MLEGGGSSVAGIVREHGFSASGWSRVPPIQSVSSTGRNSFSQLLLRGGTWVSQSSVCAIANCTGCWCWISVLLHHCENQTTNLRSCFVAELFTLSTWSRPRASITACPRQVQSPPYLVLLPSLGVILLQLVTDPGSPDTEVEKPGCLTYNRLILLQKAEEPPEDYSSLLMEGRFASKLVFHTEWGMWWTQGPFE